MSLEKSVRLLLVLVATAITFGCGGDEETQKPMPADAKPMAAATPAQAATPPSQPGAVRSSQPGSMTPLEEQLRETIEIPSFYPQDGPVYPGAKPSKVQQFPDGKVNLVFSTDAMPTEASNVMSEAAEAKGWKILSVDDLERGVLARGEKDGRNLLILTNRVDDGTAEVVTLVAVSVDP